MKDHRLEFPIGKMYKVFKISRNSYYRWCNYIPSKRDNENRSLLFEIGRVHEKSKANYGSQRIIKEPKSLGFNMSRPRVTRLMKQKEIKAVALKKM